MSCHDGILEIDKNIRQIAMSHLARREHTRFTLRKKLMQKGFLPHSVEAVLDSLIQKGLLNEERFCEMFIQKRVRQGYGPVRITAECRQYGLSNDIIFSQLPQNEEFWLAIINKIQGKKLPNTNKFSPQTQLREIRYLQYRGFTLEQIKKMQKTQ